MIKIGVDPTIFSIGPFHFAWYGLAVALGIMFVVFWASYEIKKGARISYDNLLMGAIVGIPSGIIGARLVHVIDRWEYYSQNLGQIIGGDGLSIYGGILGALLGIWIYSRYSKLNFGHLLDVVAPGIA
ncbi:MAG TPA: diacylglyceryl transferase, partial [Dehalococcoidia bacterium]|nr:diacylglyceryl transferase [Dehalococcoidia bacterium]